MNRFSTLCASTLIALGLLASAGAKPNLPVSVQCTGPSNGSATVIVTLKAPATSFVVLVRGSGSVIMEETVHQARAVSKSQKVRIPLQYRAGSAPGGLVVEVKGDFGQGVRSQIQTFTLMGQTPPGVRSQASPSPSAPAIVVVPAKTTTKER